MTMVLDPFSPLFPTHANGAGFTAPADVTVGESDLVLTMDLPGLTAEDLEIELLDAFGRFERRFQVPDGVDPTRSWRGWTTACSR
jgi:HSP20 family protein